MAVGWAFALVGRIVAADIYSQGVALGYGLVGLSGCIPDVVFFNSQKRNHMVVNLFRNNVNDVSKLSTSPVHQVTTTSGKDTQVCYSCYSATVRKSVK